MVCLFVSLVLLVFQSFWGFSSPSGVLGVGTLFGGVFCVDYVSCCLSVLSVILGFSLLFWSSRFSFFSCFMVFLSVVFALLCYSCVHALWFWAFYEMSIVPLLILLAYDSPYSERYLALWYLLGYAVVSSLPMLLCIFYLSWFSGGYLFQFWSFSGDDYFISFIICFLGMMFVMKIPLFPFHVWLPIVHAEASSPVSVCLSGYIMKLGVLGVYRFCWGYLTCFVFSSSYVVLCFIASFIFFLCAVRELDAKRWLAFFSLGHIVIVAACLGLGGYSLNGVSFIYCWGHGLSAAAMFLLIWVLSSLSGSRNLLLLKNSVWSGLVVRLISCFTLATVCCVPPTGQFFGELCLMVDSVGFSWIVPYFLCVYLYIGGLVPIVVLGGCVSRHYDVSYGGNALFLSTCSVVFLLFWCYALFIIC